MSAVKSDIEIARAAKMKPIKEILDGIKASIPKGSIADINDIIPAYLFLASSDGDHFVGQTISPNGGDHFL